MIDDDDDTFVYIGGSLECEDEDFLTSRLFLRIEMLFNNAFQCEDDNNDIVLGKDFIYICFPKNVIVVIIYQVKSNYVIDVLVWAQNNAKQDMLSTLMFVEKSIINNLTTICAQPSGVQGVTLIESVLRPDCLLYPSMVQGREHQCVKLTYLKKQLRKKLEQGEKESYDWKRTTAMLNPLSNNLIDLMGS